MSGLKFYPSAHRYKLDGAWVPGVTTILGVLNKPALPKWAAGSVAEYVADHRDAVEHLYGMGRGPMVQALKEVPWQKRDDAASRGTTFHEFAERIVQGEEVDVPQEQVPLVESALAFMDAWKVRPILTEATVGSREHRYAGKLDLIAEVGDTRALAILDWKSGKRIYPEAAYQLTAYARAEFHGEDGNESPLPEVHQAFGVHIRSDGYDVLPLAFGDDVWAEFLHIRACFDAKKRADGDWKVPGSGYVGTAQEHANV